MEGAGHTYRPILKLMIKGHAGIYALYKGEKLYYVGLANNLMNRVNHEPDRLVAPSCQDSSYASTGFLSANIVATRGIALMTLVCPPIVPQVTVVFDADLATPAAASAQDDATVRAP